MPGRRPRPILRGLTLIELAVALAVLAIFIAMAVPVFGDRMARKRLVHVAEMLSADLSEARYQAAQRGEGLHLVFKPGNDWCYAVASAPGCDCASPQPCQLKVVAAEDHPGVQLAGARDISFDPSATAIGIGQAEWREKRNAQSLTVSVTPLGRARICSPSGLPGYADC